MSETVGEGGLVGELTDASEQPVTLNDMIDNNNPAIMELCIYDSANTELNSVPVLPGSVNAAEIVICSVVY